MFSPRETNKNINFLSLCLGFSKLNFNPQLPSCSPSWLEYLLFVLSSVLIFYFISLVFYVLDSKLSGIPVTRGEISKIK